MTKLWFATSALWPFFCSCVVAAWFPDTYDPRTLFTLWLIAAAAGFPVFVHFWKRLANAARPALAYLRAFPAYLLMTTLAFGLLLLLRLGTITRAF